MINAIKFAIEEIEASDQYFDHTGGGAVRRGRAGVYVKHLILRLARPAPEDSGGGQQGGGPDTILPSTAFSCKCRS